MFFSTPIDTSLRREMIDGAAPGFFHLHVTSLTCGRVEGVAMPLADSNQLARRAAMRELHRWKHMPGAY